MQIAKESSPSSRIRLFCTGLLCATGREQRHQRAHQKGRINTHDVLSFIKKPVSALATAQSHVNGGVVTPYHPGSVPTPGYPPINDGRKVLETPVSVDLPQVSGSRR